MLNSGGFGCVGHILGLSLFLFGGEVLPEVRDAIDAVSAGKRLFQALNVVEIRLNDFCALRGQRLRLVLVRIACDGASGKSSVRIVQNRLTKSATL